VFLKTPRTNHLIIADMYLHVLNCCRMAAMIRVAFGPTRMSIKRAAVSATKQLAQQWKQIPIHTHNHRENWKWYVHRYWFVYCWNVNRGSDRCILKGNWRKKQENSKERVEGRKLIVQMETVASTLSCYNTNKRNSSSNKILSLSFSYVYEALKLKCALLVTITLKIFT
jgi:hypothetical protein